MDFPAGETITFKFRFLKDAEPVVPTSGSVTYTIRGQDGSALVGYTNVAKTTGPADSAVSIVIPSTVNVTTLRVEKRFITFSWTANGESYSQTVSYRLVPMLLSTVTKASVREKIGGISADTLKDDEIDIVQAYLQIEDKVTQSTLTTALVAGGLTEINANNAILWQACLNALPTVKLRMMQKETDGPISYERGDLTPLFDQLEDDLRNSLLAAINTLSGRTTGSFPFMAFSLPTDPITGE